MSDINEIKKLLKTDKLVIGTEATIKKLRTKGLEKVYLASNCPSDVKQDISKYTELSSVTLIVLEMPNDELGDVCKKPFSISVLGVAK
ncbi:MAG: ribosomal L7Ae/L30e/S12e/Gadd45 family protein [Nanoarchaeota archaeon]|nr:ribosomal L7Ae/L30e/S12e/Gadd45 family protein [Nanoarchaeota archaeon]